MRAYRPPCLCADHFPDAFYGQNNRIRDTLNNLILKSPQEWQTSAALPFTKIEGVVVEWDECAAAGRRPAPPPPPPAPAHARRRPARRMHFDVRLLQRVPYEGVSRMRAFCPP